MVNPLGHGPRIPSGEMARDYPQASDEGEPGLELLQGCSHVTAGLGWVTNPVLNFTVFLGSSVKRDEFLMKMGTQTAGRLFYLL